MGGPFKVAAVQAAPEFLDLDAGVIKAVKMIEDAAGKGCKLIAFPETWLPGYPWWIWLGAPAWGMQFVGRYFENSVEIGGEADKALAKAAKDNNIQVVMGLSERSGGSLYIAQWHYDEHGEIVQRRRKLKPTHVERTVYGEGDGADIVVNDTSLGRVGGLCCWEHLQPLTKYAMYSQNEQIHAAAWPSFSLYRGGAYALGPELNTSASQMYAAEGQCFVVAACGVVSQAMVDELCDTEDKKQLLLVGGGYASIFGPDGSPLGERLGETEEGLVIAEIDIGMIAFAKAAADPVGHYSRPDVFQLKFNRAETPVVVDAPKAEMETLS